ncbi:hypothetical protein Bca52824_086009 [Brassica carinata]|uniref:Uncharacterized protein n=1 Tax=Brassica carinata TaxID=52824 RepID=A0A8X7TND6_BRACI|nr:hypothetical protein Bca52824_086009 [Brassica carinata]
MTIELAQEKNGFFASLSDSSPDQVRVRTRRSSSYPISRYDPFPIGPASSLSEDDLVDWNDPAIPEGEDIVVRKHANFLLIAKHLSCLVIVPCARRQPLVRNPIPPLLKDLFVVRDLLRGGPLFWSHFSPERVRAAVETHRSRFSLTIDDDMGMSFEDTPSPSVYATGQSSGRRLLDVEDDADPIIEDPVFCHGGWEVLVMLSRGSRMSDFSPADFRACRRLLSDLGLFCGYLFLFDPVEVFILFCH